MRKNRTDKQPAVYRIRVRGRLREDWSDWFNGLAISHDTDDEDNIIATLSGFLADQSALHGILARLRDLNLELMSVEQISAQSIDDEHDQEVD